MSNRVFAVVFACLLATAEACATTIDFSSTPSGCFGAYSTAGVTFSAPGGLTSSIFGNTPDGTPGLLGCNSAFFPVITATFAAAFSGVISIDLGDFDIDADTLSLSLFNAGNVLLATTSSFIPDTFTGMVTLSAFGLGVDHAVFGGVGVAGSSVYADNFSFTAASTSVPEPNSLALIAFSFAALVLVRRRF